MIQTHEEFLQKIHSDQNITITDEMQKALVASEFTSKNLFITGSGGVGKSVFIKHLMQHTSKNIVVLAPTGVAALNVSGQTIHSFFKFPLGILDSEVKVSKNLALLWGTFDALLIDEMSMVRSDVLNAINIVMQKAGKNELPFGGKQLICVGDLFQLAPVVQKVEADILYKMYKSQWWFDAIDVSTFTVIEFTQVFRQTEVPFISALNNFRKGSHSSADIAYINSRFHEIPPDRTITLTTTNAKAESINLAMLSSLKSETVHIHGSSTGTFTESSMPAPLHLTLKPGAKVMILRNLPLHGLANGSIVYIVDINAKQRTLKIKNPESGSIVEIGQETWSQYAYEYNDGKLSKTVTGTYTQLPVKLAYSITAHKAQGCSFDKAIIDFDRGVFATGQAYVALSRVRSLDGIYLKQFVKSSDFKVDHNVTRYFSSCARI